MIKLNGKLYWNDEMILNFSSLYLFHNQLYGSPIFIIIYIIIYKNIFF
jgi:hypothetical protein